MKSSKKRTSAEYLKNPTCRFFTGYRPCPVASKHNTICPSKYCSKIDKKILIVEMGGIGSVLRTTAVAKEYKSKFPDSHITFLTTERGVNVLTLSPYVDRAFNFDLASYVTLLEEEFDEVSNFEVAPHAAALTMKVKAPVKKGFGFSSLGKPKLLNDEAHELFLFQVDNEFRANNKKSIQQLLLESVGFKWREQFYDVVYPEQENEIVEEFLSKNNFIDAKIIGLNIGTRYNHRGKRWPWQNFLELAIELQTDHEMQPLILAGPEEKDIHELILKELTKKKIQIPTISTANNIQRFAAFVNRCDIVVSAATFGLILAVGLKKKVVMINTCRPPTEINIYGGGLKVMNPLNTPPCFRTKIGDCKLEENEQFACVRAITVDTVEKAISELLSGSTTDDIVVEKSPRYRNS